MNAGFPIISFINFFINNTKIYGSIEFLCITLILFLDIGEKQIHVVFNLLLQYLYLKIKEAPHEKQLNSQKQLNQLINIYITN